MQRQLPYGQANGQTGLSPMHYAIVFGVGAVLSMFTRAPVLTGAALYTLGFWVRGRPMTAKMLDQGAMRLEQMRLAQYQAAAGQIPPQANAPLGAGVVINPNAPTATGSVRVINGNDVIDAPV